MSESLTYLEFVKRAGRRVRPELSEDELDRASRVIAQSRRPDASQVDMDQVERVRAEVRRAIADPGLDQSPSFE